MGHRYFSYYYYLALLFACMLMSEISVAQIGVNVFPTAETSYKNSLTGVPESSFNPYQDYEFHEAFETALSLHAAGNHVQALKLLQKAFNSSRVQEGFYNETQVAVQKAIIDIEKGQGNWEKVDELYSHLELMYRRLYDRNPHKLEDGLREISAWLSYSLMLYRLGSAPKIASAYRILKQRLEIVEKQLGGIWAQIILKSRYCRRRYPYSRDNSTQLNQTKILIDTEIGGL